MKEVIFHFFPSVRFLGLSLKILFHKNKEIERMLSKKMAFSLMSLITLLALAFVTLPASAADPFDVTFEGRESCDLYPPVALGAAAPDMLTVIVTIKTGLPVEAPDALGRRYCSYLTVTAFDKNNLVVDVMELR